MTPQTFAASSKTKMAYKCVNKSSGRWMLVKTG